MCRVCRMCSVSRSKGALLKKHYSRTARFSYLANTCNNCNAFIGNNYLVSHFREDQNDIENSRFFVGYYCEECLIKSFED